MDDADVQICPGLLEVCVDRYAGPDQDLDLDNSPSISSCFDVRAAWPIRLNAMLTLSPYARRPTRHDIHNKRLSVANRLSITKSIVDFCLRQTFSINSIKNQVLER